jgi:hypothetical protein
MADTKISALTAIDAVAAGDEFAANDASAVASRKVTAAQLKTFAGSEAWHGAIIGCMGEGDPSRMLTLMQHAAINATPTQISTSVARISYFRPEADITVNTIRFFGVGATTGIYHVAIYRHSDLARLTADLSPDTVLQEWGSVAVSPSVTLTAGTLYFVAVSVDTTGTTAGMQCFTGTGKKIGVLPSLWPGNLDLDAASPKIHPIAVAQFAVTTGALPDPANTIAAQNSWNGGMPAIFLDNA